MIRIPYTRLLTIALLIDPSFAAVSQCSVDDALCSSEIGSRTGSAMLQTENSILKPHLFASSEADSKFLENDVALLEKEMAALVDKTTVLENVVGAVPGEAPAPATVAESLVSVKQVKADSLTAKVTALETTSLDLKGRVQSLETFVHGGTSSLLSSNARTASDSLESRVKTLQADVADMKERVTKLEHEVTGSSLAQEPEGVALGAIDDATKKFLENDVKLLESEMETLGAKVVKLESAVGSGGASSSAGAAPEAETSESLVAVDEHAQKADGLKERVGALEQVSSDLKGRLESLEGNVFGSARASLITSVHLGAADIDSLSSRVKALKELNANLQTRATKLEHVVTGSSLVEAAQSAQDPEGMALGAIDDATKKFLENDVKLLESEMESLGAKVVKLESAVGSVGASSSVGAETEAETSESLVAVDEHAQKADGLKERVGALEQVSSDLKGRLESLEGNVFGSARASLITSVHLGAADIDSLSSRVQALKELNANLQTRATKLEHVVTGSSLMEAAQSAQDPEGMALGAIDDATKKFLENDVKLLESEMETLGAKVAKLETAVGSGGASSSAGAETEGETSESLVAVEEHKENADGLKQRVGVLEQTSSDLKGRLESLESSVFGNARASLITSSHHGAAGTDTLTSRVNALKELTANLQNRATKLEHVVTGSSLIDAGRGWSTNTAPGSDDTTLVKTESDESTSTKYLENDVEQVETEMSTLTTQVERLETAIGKVSATTPGGVDAEVSLISIVQEPSEALKPRVTALETASADLKGRVLTLVHAIHGSTALSMFSQASTISDDLAARVEALQEDVEKLKTTVIGLDHLVLGGSALFQAKDVPEEQATTESDSSLEAAATADSKSSVATMSASKQKYLVNDVDQLEKGMAVLKSKTTALESTMEESSTALISNKQEATDLVSRVQTLEADAESMESRVAKLEQDVSGASVASTVSLLGRADGLVDRIKALQDIELNLKQRVISLEQRVTGSSLLDKNDPVPEADEFSMTKDDASGTTKSKYLVNDVEQMIKEVEDLKTRIATLETTVGGSGATAAESLLHARRDDLATKVEALETDTADLKSRVDSLETIVHGSTVASFTSLGKGDGLKARIGTLQETVKDLKQRVTALEHRVTGL